MIDCLERATRRAFLTRAAGAAAAGSIALPTLSRAAASQTRSGSSLVYVGSYSNPKGPEGSNGHGKGIYLFEMNSSSGELKQREVFEDDSNPSWLALHPSRKFLFAADEVSDFKGAKSGCVSSYAIDHPSGRLTKINSVASQGAGPAHLSVHPSGNYVLVANYYGGSFAVLPIDSVGRLAEASDVKIESGSVGPLHATSAPPGSFAISGHDKPHGHMIESDPSGRFVLACDLGLDQIKIWKFDAHAGKLNPNAPASVSVPPGDGPRHFVFHPNRRWVYSLQEEASTLMLFDFDSASGKLAARQTLSTLPPGFVGTNFTSEIRISPDARFVYAANRLHDSIAWFSIASDGTLKFVGEVWTRGDYPRSFTIDPGGNFLYSCNQRGDAIATFRVDRNSGGLTFTGQYTALGTPAIVLFL